MTDYELMYSALNNVLKQYKQSFANKIYSQENNEHDLIMDIFGISPELKRENRQYWGRELGMCWQKIVIEIFKCTHKEYGPAKYFNKNQPYDLTIGKYAIDTKYRIGSGDSGTLKKFKSYGSLLKANGYDPVFLIVREDNLQAAISACLVGGWTVLTGKDSYAFIKDNSDFDVKCYLEGIINTYQVQR